MHVAKAVMINRAALEPRLEQQWARCQWRSIVNAPTPGLFTIIMSMTVSCWRAILLWPQRSVPCFSCTWAISIPSTTYQSPCFVRDLYNKIAPTLHHLFSLFTFIVGSWSRWFYPSSTFIVISIAFGLGLHNSLSPCGSSKIIIRVAVLLYIVLLIVIIIATSLQAHPAKGRYLPP